MVQPTDVGPSMEFDDLVFHGPGASMQEFGCALEVSDDGIEFGSSEAVTSVMRRMWADGSSVSQDGADNAETVFFLRIRGPLHELGGGEAAVRSRFPGQHETRRLVFRPAPGVPAAVRIVLRAEMKLQWDGFVEAGLMDRRVYKITMVHAPFVQSEFEATVAALPVGEVPTVESVDEFSSGSDWSFSSGRPSTPLVTVAGGVLKAQATHTGSNIRSQYSWNLTRSTSITMSAATPYLIVEHRVLGGTVTNPGLRLFGMDWPAGTPMDRARMLRWVSGGLTVDGWTRTVFYTPKGVGRLTLGATTAFSTEVAVPKVEVRLLQRSSSPAPHSGRALLRTIDIDGTERTPGALHIGTRTGSLGTVMVHTSPDAGDGYSPDLLGGDVAATSPTAGADSPSGWWYDLNPAGNVTTRLDGARFTPGTYTLVAWVQGHATESYSGTLVASVASSGRMGGPTLSSESVSAPLTVPALGLRAIVLGRVTLPGVRSKVGGVSITVSASGTNRPKVGGLWAFRVGYDCALSIQATDQPHMWLSAANLTTPREVLVSDVGDRAQAWALGAASIQMPASHVFRPPRTSAYVFASNAPNAAADFTSPLLWQNFPARDGSGS